MKKIFIALTLLITTSSFALSFKPISEYGDISYDMDRNQALIAGGVVYPMTEALADQWNSLKSQIEPGNAGNCKAKINQVRSKKEGGSGWVSIVHNQLFGLDCTLKR